MISIISSAVVIGMVAAYAAAMSKFVSRNSDD